MSAFSSPYVTTAELAQLIKYEERTIRNALMDTVLLEGRHYFRPFGGRKILFNWPVIEEDMLSASKHSRIAMPVATSEVASDG